MKKKTNASIFLALFMSFIFIACSNEKKDEPATTDAAKTETPAMPAYDAAMDPVKVEAAFIKMFADTLGVKFYEATFKPGDSIGMHTHPDNIIYVLEGSTAEMTLQDGTKQVVEFKTGMGMVGGPVTHAGKNIGSTNLRLLVSDIYRPRS